MSVIAYNYMLIIYNSQQVVDDLLPDYFGGVIFDATYVVYIVLTVFQTIIQNGLNAAPNATPATNSIIICLL